jgi:stage II sporulation protein D
MQKIVLNNTKHFIIVFLCLFILGGQPVKLAKEKTFFHGYLISKPIIKIGLGVNLDDIKIRSSSGMKIYEINSSYRLIAENADEVFIRGRREKLTEKYIIQVARFRHREDAEIFAQDLRTQIENKVYVTEAGEEVLTGTYQVMVGDFMTRGDALSFIKRLNQLGMEDTWILREEITEEDSKPLWILVNDELKSLHDEAVLYFVPSNPQSFLSYGKRDYKGILLLRASRKGIVLINILNVEDYLKGVVPSELSPYDFPELEAHKAQAVAARTYAIKNLGSNRDLGYDIGDTPSTQFYRGMGAENALSTEAVEQTRGKVVLYKGKLINALYTSTCGGMTENVEEIFGGPALSYLRSTECVYDKQKEWLLEGGHSLHPIFINGKNVTPSVASLINLKVIPHEGDSSLFEETPPFEEAFSWIKNAAKLVGIKDDVSLPKSPQLGYKGLASLMIHALGWKDRAQSLLLEKEKDFLLRGLEGLDDDSERHMAYLIQEGIFPPADDIGDLERSLLRGEIALYLWRAIQSHPGLIRSGVFKSLNNDVMIWVEKGDDKESVLSSPLFLLRQSQENRSIAEKIHFIGGEDIRLIEKEGKIYWLELVDSPHSNTLDRSSVHHAWKVRKSRERLEERINQFYPVGKLKDLIPQKKGNSNRIVELLIEGTDGRIVVKGLRIRRVLGLKETLFVINREYDENRDITHFTFSGRGWGHGVGLCQVGAFGMARAGADYEEILKKYYSNIKIKKIY